ncbi:hypothetical protein CY34DRAFT_799065, partial [Suillus luteus UH-Slu-Lm8-n1]
MRFSFAIVLVVAAALASSTSAAPIDDQAICPLMCRLKTGVCQLDATVLNTGEWVIS